MNLAERLPNRCPQRSTTSCADRAHRAFHYTPEIIQGRSGSARGNVDVVLAGPPCEGHSNLNNSTRRDDPRNELYLSVPAFAVAVEPPWSSWRTYPGPSMTSVGVVETAAALLRNSGYQLAMGVIGASRLGWPQKRERFFLVARYGMPLAIEDVQTALASPPRSLVWAISRSSMVASRTTS
ncbi:MAG: DNA cytosine methyltransferase [Acidimicrobiia bacterium]|nr:DNA cytosine methyltransferase [Acidimicrobiia bacterium]